MEFIDQLTNCIKDGDIDEDQYSSLTDFIEALLNDEELSNVLINELVKNDEFISAITKKVLKNITLKLQHKKKENEYDYDCCEDCG